MEPVQQAPHRRRRLAAVLVTILVVVCLGWSALWWLASAQAASALDAWLVQEAKAGRFWTCPQRTLQGFPFALALGCGDVTFHGEVAGRAVSGLARGAQARVGLDAPKILAIDLTGPLHLRADNGDFDLAVAWSALHLRVSNVADPSQGTMEATRFAATLSAPGHSDLNLRAGHLTGRAEPTAGSDAQPGEAAFAFQAEEIAFPTVDALLGGSDEIDAEGRGVLTRADLLSVPNLAHLEAWRKANGRLKLAGLKLVRGTFTGQASGVLGLDAGHRAAGRLDSTLAGFGPIAERFGIPVAGVQLGGLLSGLLGGAQAPAPDDAAGDAVRLPLVFSDGRLNVGPFQTPVRIDPMY